MMETNRIDGEVEAIESVDRLLGGRWGEFSPAFINNADLMPADTEYASVSVDGDPPILVYRSTYDTDRVVDILAKAAAFDMLMPMSRQNRKPRGVGLQGTGGHRFTLDNQAILYTYSLFNKRR